MYLLDTSISLELLLDRERADEVAEFLKQEVSGRLYMSDFSLHSIGIILLRQGNTRKAYGSGKKKA